MWDKQKVEDEVKSDELTSAVTGAKQTLKGLCVHEQLHNNPSLCPVVVTEKTVDVAAQSAEKAVEKVSDVVNGHKETLHAKK
eukprot:gene34359-38840_t